MHTETVRNIVKVENVKFERNIQIQRSLPKYVKDSIFTHHFLSFNSFKRRIHRTHFNKFMGLLNQKRNERISTVKNIRYTYFPKFNKFCYNRIAAVGGETVDSHINISVIPENFDINKSNASLEQVNKKWFINLSDKVIPKEVSLLLQFGDRFCLPNSINKKTAIHEFIKDIESNVKYHNYDKLTAIRNIAIPQFYKYLKSSPKQNGLDNKIINMYNITERFCKNNKDIIFTRADKGNMTVAMQRSFYIERMEEMLSDEDTYSVIRKNPIKNIENTLNNILKKWLQCNYITKQQYYKFHSSDSKLPKAYGLPKIHKHNTPFRIIVSSINTALYSLASYLQNIIFDSLENAIGFCEK